MMLSQPLGAGDAPQCKRRRRPDQSRGGTFSPRCTAGRARKRSR
jgi:hypothetical protein